MFVSLLAAEHWRAAVWLLTSVLKCSAGLSSGMTTVSELLSLLLRLAEPKIIFRDRRRAPALAVKVLLVGMSSFGFGKGCSGSLSETMGTTWTLESRAFELPFSCSCERS